MPLTLHQFPLLVGNSRVSFINSFGDNRRRSGLGHDAIDIGAPLGTTIVSSTPGKVLRQWVSKKTRETVTGCGWSDRGGNIVLILDQTNNHVHYYAHMQSQPLVSPGADVAVGQPIGAVSNTGALADGGPIHLHYQVWAVRPGSAAEIQSLTFTRPLGAAVNPYPELRRLARSAGARMSGSYDVTSNAREGSLVIFNRPRP
jgi:murein DD-endopeptidase MepM/ murein hydrolase activator NlpD